MVSNHTIGVCSSDNIICAATCLAIDWPENGDGNVCDDFAYCMSGNAMGIGYGGQASKTK